MREQHIEVVRKACVAANPEIVESHQGEEDGEIVWIEIFRPIRLADVLLAMGRKWRINGSGYFDDGTGKVLGTPDPYWNLCANDLTQQSDETLKFLADLLTPSALIGDKEADK